MNTSPAFSGSGAEAWALRPTDALLAQQTARTRLRTVGTRRANAATKSWRASGWSSPSNGSGVYRQPLGPRLLGTFGSTGSVVT